MLQRFLRFLGDHYRNRDAASDSESWRRDVAVIAESELFDRHFYLRNNPDVAASGMDPVEHYVRYGASERRRPSRNFDTAFYLESNPDVAKSGQNPLRHFIEFGEREGRRALPSLLSRARPQADDGGGVEGAKRVEPDASDERQRRWAYRVIAESKALDKRFYLARYSRVAETGLDPVWHFVNYGAAERKDPSEAFSTKYYLERYRDVARRGINPLAHYLKYGWREFRDPSPNFSTAWYWLLHMGGALDAGSPIEHFLEVGRRVGLKTYPKSISAPERRRINASVKEVVVAELPVRFYERLADSLAYHKLWQSAELVCRYLTSREWGVAKHHERLAKILAAQVKRWQQVSSIKDAIQVGGASASRYFSLGLAYEEMERWSEAAEAFKAAIGAGASDQNVHYRLGYALEKCGKTEADSAYRAAISICQDQEVRRFGVGVLHQQQGRWANAANAYSRRLIEEPLDPNLHYRLGMAYDRLYRWDDAERSYGLAVSFDPNVAYWHYRLGFVRERRGNYLGAADAYKTALDVRGQEHRYWRYRMAYALMKAGRHSEACEAFLGLAPSSSDGRGGVTPQAQAVLAAKEILGRIDDALAEDYSRADWHFARGFQLEMLGEWQEAECAYRNAIDRCQDYRSDWYRRLGYVMYRQGKFQEACEALRETHIARAAYGVDSSKYERSSEERTLLSYQQYIQDLPIRARTILYESYAGVAMGCNPLAIFRFLLSSPEYAEWTHVWVVSGVSAVSKTYRQLRNVIFVERGSDLYLRYLASCSHLINNATFPSWFIRREGQKYLNTWHGTPLKTLGKDIKGSFMERKNTARNFLQATHLISPNAHTTRVLVERYDVAGVLTARVAETGYPRVDPVLRLSADERSEVRERLGLKKGEPVVLYAPTWRGTLGSATLDLQMLSEAVTRLAGLKCQLVFRGHYFSEQQLEKLALPVTIASYDVDTSELLAVTDILVTDYSSILFDFLPLRRPIIYFAYDVDEYSEQRGLYLRPEEVAGKVCSTVESLVDAVSNAIEGGVVNVTAYEGAIERFCPHDDGNATARAVRFFLHEETSADVELGGDVRRPILFYAGNFIPNGITTSFLNLVSALDASRYRVVLVIDPDAVEESDLRLDQFAMLPEHVQVIARVGRMVASPEERWLMAGVRKWHSFPSEEMWDVYLAAYRREFRRIFGSAEFFAVVQFDGYSPFWTALLLGGTERASRVIYLHNDMRGEMEVRFPHLRGLFALYNRFDSLVSVSKAMSEANRQKLSQEFSVDPSKFTFAENVINHERILAAASQSLDPDIAGWMDGRVVFLTMGRMSPEKDHEKLLRAFKVVSAKFGKAGLIVVGDGPLRECIEQLIASLELHDFVMLAGQRLNPFPALSACDCFVLSSNHEGQPMVLLEAMTLGKPIIATDIDGNRGALIGRGGVLVQNSVEGLAEGMMSFLQGGVEPPVFDPILYRKSALSHFSRAILDVADGDSQLLSEA
jgi:CDP-glycerol glycerophosphotransferase